MTLICNIILTALESRGYKTKYYHMRGFDERERYYIDVLDRNNFAVAHSYERRSDILAALSVLCGVVRWNKFIHRRTEMYLRAYKIQKWYSCLIEQRQRLKTKENK